MLCYKDMTFCSRKDCGNINCRRHWNRVEEYFNSVTDDEFILPVSVGEFTGCDYYINTDGATNDK